MVFEEKVTNNFFSYGKSSQKILMAFLTKTFSFVAIPEFNFRSPMPVKNFHSGPPFSRKKGRIRHCFLLQTCYMGQKNGKGAKQNFEVNHYIKGQNGPF